MTTDESTITDPFDRVTVKSASKVAIATLSLVFLLYLLTLLPGVDRVIPLTPVTFAAVVTAVVTLAVVGLLLYAAPKFAALTRLTLEGTEASEHAKPVVENVAALVYWLVALAAVIVAHRGFAGAVVPLLDGFEWAYDAGFLLVALGPVVFVVARLTVTVDPLAELVADRVSGPRTDDASDDASPEEPITVEEGVADAERDE